MRIDSHDNYVIVKDDNNDLKNLVLSLTPIISIELKDKNIVIDLLNFKNISLKDLLLFQAISSIHKDTNKSFVIVTNILNPNELPEEMVVVPTLQEAEDLIEMEEIERELGF